MPSYPGSAVEVGEGFGAHFYPPHFIFSLSFQTFYCAQTVLLKLYDILNVTNQAARPCIIPKLSLHTCATQSVPGSAGLFALSRPPTTRASSCVVSTSRQARTKNDARKCRYISAWPLESLKDWVVRSQRTLPCARWRCRRHRRRWLRFRNRLRSRKRRGRRWCESLEIEMGECCLAC